MTKPVLPSSIVLAIDVGHGRGDPGALSAHGIPEYDYNRRLAGELLTALRRRGFKQAFLLGQDPAAQGRQGLRERTRIAREKGADVLLSIHHDSVQPRYLKEWLVDGTRQRFSDAFEGFSLFVSSKNPWSHASRRLATLLGDELHREGLEPSVHHAESIPGEGRTLIDPERGIYDVDFWVVAEADMPSVLLEAGIITDREEEKRLDTREHRERIVRALVRAISEFVKRPEAG